MKIWTMAGRHIMRNGRRSGVTIGAMAFAGAMMVFYVSLFNGFISSMERHALSVDTGDLQIHAQGYLEDPDLYKRIEAPAPVLASLDQAGLHAAPRLYGYGLGAAGTSSAGVQLRGLDLARESRVTVLSEQVAQGTWLDAAAPNEVVVGRKLAKTLGLSPGSELVILSQDTQGYTANELYRVRGVLGVVNEVVDRAGVLMTEGAFRELMAMPEGAHEIIIARADPQSPLEGAVASAQQAAPGMEVKTWRELLPILSTMLDSSSVGMGMMLVITYSAVAMVILNAMLMSVFERIREFGVMKAVGVGPGKVAALILAETVLQAVVASLLALALGVPASLYFQTHGIDLSSFMSGTTIGGVAMTPVWRCDLTLDSVVQPLGFLFVINLMAVIYPAIKAALIKPVDALHHR